MRALFRFAQTLTSSGRARSIPSVSARCVLSAWSRSGASWCARCAAITCPVRTIIDADCRCGARRSNFQECSSLGGWTVALKMTDRVVDEVAVEALEGRIVLGEESNALREKVKSLLAAGQKK